MEKEVTQVSKTGDFFEPDNEGPRTLQYTEQLVYCICKIFVMVGLQAEEEG